MANRINRYFRRHPLRTQRILEILPGFVSWSLILFPIWGSFIVPNLVAYYVILFAVYWLYRSCNMAILSLSAHFAIQAASQYDWLNDLNQKYPGWQKVHHLIIIPTYQEPISTLQRTLRRLGSQSVPLSNIHIMISFEEREGQVGKKKANDLTQEFGQTFGSFWTTFHPDIAGEVKGKSANTAWGARQATKLLAKYTDIPVDQVTITSEDADASLHHQYFAAVTYDFLSLDKPYNVIWQGAVMFYNNIWQVPAPIRVIAAVFSVTQMYILKRADKLVNFSTYTTTLKHVVDIGFWDTDVIPEDYRLFFKSYFAKKGDFTVRPIFLPIYADAAQAKGWWRTMVNQYEQLKRWAWGTSDDAYIIKQYVLAEGVPFWDKTLRVLKTIEDHFLWPVNWFAITIAAFFPPLLNENFSRTMLGKTLPQVTSALLTLSLVSLLVIFIIDALNRPPRPGGRNVFSYILQPLEFLMLPILGFFFSALPGLDAHTRLMIGRYLEYRVTEKI